MSTFTARPCSAAAAADTRIIVRTYDSAALPDQDRARAIDVANAILQHAGVGMLWVPCGAAAPGGTSDPCVARLATNEIALRFVARPPAATRRFDEVALGYSLIDRHATFAALATIYVEPVERLASGCRVPWTTVLGRAVAHEIGHLLLGSSDHAATGLMRAVWPRRIVERNREDDFQFTAAEASALRLAVDARNAALAPGQIVWSTE